MTPQSAGINLQLPQSDSTPWTLTLTYIVHTTYAEVWIKLLRIFELGFNFDPIFVESGAEPKTASAAQQRASCTRSTQQRRRGEILQKLRTEK